MPYRARTSFVTPVSKKHPVKRAVGLGNIVTDKDWLVKEYPDLFEATDEYIERVEQATANPGELRDAVITKPKSRTAKK